MPIQVITDTNNFINDGGNPALSSNLTYEIESSFTGDTKIEINLINSTDGTIQSQYDYRNYKPVNVLPNNLNTSSGANTFSEITIDPQEDFLNIFGGGIGQFTLSYNVYDNIIGSSNERLFIREISSNRTELRLDSVSIPSSNLSGLANNLASKIQNLPYQPAFSLNFGNNRFISAVNIDVDGVDLDNFTILVKLQDPLPTNFNVNDTLWIIDNISSKSNFNIISTPDPVKIVDTLSIKGPNFNIDVKDQVNNSTLPLSYFDLIKTNSTSSLDQLNNILNEKEININVDYTDFNNFVHFSSAKTRIENFYYKVQLIESYSSSLAILNNTSTSTNMSSSKASFEGKISNIINNFDGYDRYLYYNTGSSSYPKTTSEIPYTLAKSDSTAVISWLGNGNFDSPLYGGILSSASAFDIDNRNQLLKSIPEYLRDDPSNQQYELFVDMVAQHYDNIWIYLKDITNKYDNDNRLNFGISKDLVADAIRDFGVKLYQNNFSSNDLYTAFLGLTPEGSSFPYPNMTGSLPTPSGFEYVNTLISASNDILPQEDVNKSLYKRIYHNLPYLLNSKGTIPGLRALITSYGIPDTILRINEYGGKDKINENDWDHWQNEFNYEFNTSGSNFISSSWDLHPSWSSVDNVPETIMFRFKPGELPVSGIKYSQSLWHQSNGTALTLRYSGSGYTSGSYNGSVKDPNYQYAYLDFYPDISNVTTTASIYLPFYDGGWWSVMVMKSGSEFNLYSQNKIYEGGNNDTRIGFTGSSTITGNPGPWTGSAINALSFFPSSGSILTSYVPLSGSYQEVRYYATKISESVFKDYTMNPYSIEGNTINSSPSELAFRASLGGELYSSSVSIHPKVTGSWVVTQSFSGSTDKFGYYVTPKYIPNTEFFFVDQPVAGIKNVIGDKIRIEDNVFPTGSVLSPYRSLLQQTNASQSYTPNINYLEVAFSPQNQINDDIMSQLGFFDLGEYIGDPRLRSSSAESYPDLDKLRDEYFQKYIKNYDLKDFIRLIKFFDNSLFKMIKNFVPARTSLASGLVIKQHLLERNKYPQPQINDKTTIAKFAKSGSIIYNQPIKQQNLLISGTVLPQSRDYNSGSIVKTSGGAGGSLNQFNGLNTSPYGVLGTGPNNKYFLTQSWSQSINYLSGSINSIISNQDEFYNGEFSGSNIVVTTQSLAHQFPLVISDLNYSTKVYKNEYYQESFVSAFSEGQFLNPSTTPCDGEILFLAPYLKADFILGQGIVFKPTNPYMKIHKDDCNGENNGVALGQANILKVQNFGEASYTTYDIINKTEYPTYYNFQLKKGNLDASGSGIYSTVENYFITASRTSSYNMNIRTIFDNWSTITSASFHCGFEGFPDGKLYFGNTPNITLTVSASFNITATGGIGVPYGIYLTNQGNGNRIAVGSWVDNTNSTASFNTLLYPFKGETYAIEMDAPGGVTRTIDKAEFLVTQSVASSASQCVPVFMEPYITLNNYYNSDFNPTINNVMDSRKNTIYQDVDYSQGINIPVNFGFLISGSAEKFPIPDSHYTQKSSTIPRYEGAKYTTEKLNVWTDSPFNQGTYGQVPAINSLKTKVVYADWIGGYPPEHMNASGVHIQYLIDENGSIKIPNTSENSLEDVQQSFESKNNIIINSTTIGTGEATPLRNIIRGGSRIEPILYTQYGHSPALWNVTASFVGDFVTDQTTVNSYEVTSKPSATAPTIPLNTYTKLDFNQIVVQGGGTSYSSGEFVVTQAMIDENITITVNSNIGVYIKEGALGAQTFTIYAKLVKERGGVVTNLGGSLINSSTLSQGNTSGNLYINANQPQYNSDYSVSRTVNGITNTNTFPLSATIPPQTLRAGDKIYVQGKHQVSTPNTGVTGGDVRYKPGNSDFRVNQDPIPSSNAVSSSGTNTIWGYPSTTDLTAITASNTVLNQFYGRGYKMNNTKGYVTGSGFGTVSLDWELEIGDEFRFEGNENNTFMVKKIYGSTETDSGRVSQTGSLEVQFNGSLPSSSINLDHFLIRRYVPDASQIVMQGFKPTNAVGPYIIKPEYVTSLLNKGIDDYIVDLTDKDLI
jgi:hypothetical protein